MFTNKEKIEAHVRGFHKKKSCKFCDGVFETDESIKIHLKSVHEEKVRDLTCEICKQVFQVIGHFKQYIRHVHNDSKPTCNICGKRFSQDFILTGHIKSVHEGEFPFPCYKCELKFSNEKYLKKHRASKHSTDNHYCNKCPKVCKTKVALKQYIRRIHIRPMGHKCTHCEKAFTDSGDMKKHIRVVHEKVHPFKCEYCGKTFSNSNNLKYLSYSKNSYKNI